MKQPSQIRITGINEFANDRQQANEALAQMKKIERKKRRKIKSHRIDGNTIVCGFGPVYKQYLAEYK